MFQVTLECGKKKVQKQHRKKRKEKGEENIRILLPNQMIHGKVTTHTHSTHIHKLLMYKQNL